MFALKLSKKQGRYLPIFKILLLICCCYSIKRSFIMDLIKEWPAASSLFAASLELLSSCQPSYPFALYSLAGTLAYALLCSYLRHRRVHRQEARRNFPDRGSMSRMTNVEAQSIINEMAQLEFPIIFKISLQFALFKVIISILSDAQPRGI